MPTPTNAPDPGPLTDQDADKEGERANEGGAGGPTPEPLPFETIREANKIDGEEDTGGSLHSTLPSESLREVSQQAKLGEDPTRSSETG